MGVYVYVYVYVYAGGYQVTSCPLLTFACHHLCLLAFACVCLYCVWARGHAGQRPVGWVCAWAY